MYFYLERLAANDRRPRPLQCEDQAAEHLLTAFDDIEVGVVPRPLFVQLLREMVVFIFVMFCPRQATESI